MEPWTDPTPPGAVPTLAWRDDPPAVLLLDQTLLPGTQRPVPCADVDALCDAVARLVVRGAPVLGVAAAYGVALAALRGDDVPAAAAALAGVRPTAVNLSAGAGLALAAWRRSGGDPRAVLAAAHGLARADAAASAAMARHGLGLVPPDARVLTHCNTGRLVSAGAGTAFAVVAAAHAAGRLAHLWVDETRPLLQGARLTAFEAAERGIPHRVLVDSAAGALMAQGMVDLVLVGADRVTADGSVANKVGTYALAVLARHHGVPFVVVAPTTTVDPGTADGRAVEIEQRSDDEVTAVAGTPTAPAGSSAWNPAFDVTPPGLVSALVTERGVLAPVTAAGLAAVLADAG